MTAAQSGFYPLERCLQFLVEPRELSDEHVSVASLLHHKHTHAIVSPIVKPAAYSFNRLTGLRFMVKAAVRRWELLPGYDEHQVYVHRLRGRTDAEFISAAFQDRAAWPEALQAIADPVARDTASDVLRGWW